MKFDTGRPPGWVTVAIVAEQSHVHPRYYDPDTPRIVWYYRILALHNARAKAEEYKRRKQEQRAKMNRRR